MRLRTYVTTRIWLLMKLEYLLLGLLACRPFDGYEIMKWLETEGQFLRSKTHHSQVYRDLGRMVANGWVEYSIDPREHTPDAKVYRITEIGRDALLGFVRSPYTPPSRFHDADFTSRFVFTVGVDLDAAERLVSTELEYRRAQVARNRGRDRSMRFRDSIPELDVERFALIGEELHQFGMASVDAWMAFLEHLQGRLAELRRPSDRVGSSDGPARSR